MKLNYKKVFFVGLAFFLISLFWQTYDSIITKILIDKFGLNQTWSGVVMAMDNVLAIFLLPLFGSLSDKTNAKRGRRTPYIIFGTIAAAIAFVGLSFTDHVQTVRIETETSVVEDYQSIQDGFLSHSDWATIFHHMIDEREAALLSQEINTIEYNDFQVNISVPMRAIIDEDEILNSSEMSTLQSLYQDYLDMLSLSQWNTILTDMQAERDQALLDGRISQSTYDSFESDIYTPATEITSALLTDPTDQDLVNLEKLYNKYLLLEYSTDWSSIFDLMSVERTTALNDGLISQQNYDTFVADIQVPMHTILTADGTLDSSETDQLKDYYYNYLNMRAWQLTTHNPSTFIVFSVILFFALVSMATFRSPAVALMPDVVIKPLRSKANAVINLMGTFGGILSIALLTIFGLNKYSYVNYAPAFYSVGVLMLVLLAIFLWKVKEPKLVAEREAEDIRLGLTEEEEAKELNESVEDLSKDKKKSLYLILISVFLWFIGYNAVTTKLSDYAPKVLNLDFGTPLLIAQGAALIAFIPIGFLATKIGRRKTILIGITLLALCFGSIYFLTTETASLMYLIFALTGIGWATINVNSYPMVVELSKGTNVGKYTGYYYTFSMAAQIITPILSGLLMDELGRKVLFPYATLFVVLAFGTMFFVKHGDAKVIGKDSALENFDVDMD
ncbi:MAG: MFS transporter [Candidatus Izemoplasmatales bacterium]|nr:MFS transporter [Candidatus Izemoplasmatales bacterium]